MQVKSKCPKGLNVLCNNAGVMALGDKATTDGYDCQMQTNHLSHFLLTKELWPLLEMQGANARVVNHSSLSALGASLEPKYLVTPMSHPCHTLVTPLSHPCHTLVTP